MWESSLTRRCWLRGKKAFLSLYFKDPRGSKSHGDNGPGVRLLYSKSTGIHLPNKVIAAGFWCLFTLRLWRWRPHVQWEKNSWTSRLSADILLQYRGRAALRHVRALSGLELKEKYQQSSTAKPQLCFQCLNVSVYSAIWITTAEKQILGLKACLGRASSIYLKAVRGMKQWS